MKINWRGFLYFQRGDRTAILLLLILIVLCGGISIVYDSWTRNAYLQKQQELDAEFSRFERTLEEKESKMPETFGTETPKVGGAKLSEGETLELNGADIAALKRLPGIGDSYAKRIKEYHDLLGGFKSVEQLIEIQGITEKRINDIGPYITLRNKPKQIQINRLTAEELVLHPYIHKKQAEAIIMMRQKNGDIKNINDLLQSKTFTPRDLDRLSGYISFE